MLPYVEILAWNANKTALVPFTVVEPSECWFEISYYENGQFEVYAPATAENLIVLQKWNYVKIPHKAFLWVITSLQYEFNADGARMVSAKGYEAKFVVGKRIIRDPMSLPSNLKNAMDALFARNLGNLAINVRKINGLRYSFASLSEKTTEAQATRNNLLEFTQNLLKLHRCGTFSTLDTDGKILFYAVNGQDKSDTVLFSQSFDNLISSTFYTSDENTKTNSQIVSTFNEDDQTREIVAYSPTETSGESGIDRAEIIVQSNLSTKVKNEDGTETDLDPDGEEYANMQKAEGSAALAEHRTVTEFNGELDLAHSPYVFGVDFSVGDLVGIRDEYFGISAKARVLKYTIKQDATGYGEQADYGTE